MTGEENSVIAVAHSRRVVIENVQPQVDCGRFPIKRTIGDRVMVTADIFADGHDILHAVLRHRPASETEWQEVPMEPQPNDRWQGEFTVPVQGRHLYTLQAWIDRFQSWSRDLEKKFEAAQDISVDMMAGVQLIEATAARASGKDKSALTSRGRRDTQAGRNRLTRRGGEGVESGAEGFDDPERGPPPGNHLRQGTGGHRRSRKGPLQRLV